MANWPWLGMDTSTMHHLCHIPLELKGPKRAKFVTGSALVRVSSLPFEACLAQAFSHLSGVRVTV